MTAGKEVVFADATNCSDSCTFDWSVNGTHAGTTVDNAGADALVDVAGLSRPAAFERAVFFTAHSQLTYAFTPGTHLVSVTITDALQRTITLELEVEVAAAPLGSPPETDTLGNAGPTNAVPRLPIVVFLVSVGLLLVAAGFGAWRRGQSDTSDRRRGLPR